MLPMMYQPRANVRRGAVVKYSLTVEVRCAIPEALRAGADASVCNPL